MAKKKNNRPTPEPSPQRGGESSGGVPKKGEEGKSHKPNWRERYATIDEIEQFLSDHTFLRRNLVKGCVECRMPEGGGWCMVDSGWERLTDYWVNSLWRRYKREKEVLAHDLRQVMESDFVPDFHPMRHYLEHLPPWDGLNHIMALSTTVNVRGGADEQMRFYQYLRKWLVGMVAAWLDPEVVNHQILVLIGPQGAYKTTWFSHLLPPELRDYFRIKTNASRMSKDDLLSLTRYALVCYEELDTMTPRDLNELKSAVTMPSVDERRPYGHYTEHYEHIASFCGTGNNVQFLSDPTGNRRWLPFEVVNILSPRDNPLDYEGIYAEAYALYRQGFQYWFLSAESQRQSEHNRQFEVPRLEQELVQQYFRKPRASEPGEFISVALALQVVGANITQKLSAVMLGRAFVELGFERRTVRNVRGYVAMRRTAEEMRAVRMQMADEANADTDTHDTDAF